MECGVKHQGRAAGEHPEFRPVHMERVEMADALHVEIDAKLLTNPPRDARQHAAAIPHVFEIDVRAVSTAHVAANRDDASLLKQIQDTAPVHR
ncbi:hypothetical protein WM23_12625 [Burkholderia ubonensis]|nr:hypothetical protein WM23_12625 [Burkholderia ubonensis]